MSQEGGIWIVRLTDYRIIWRFEGSIAGLQRFAHIRVLPWLPLQSILAHPRTIAMVTHGGINRHSLLLLTFLDNGASWIPA